MLSIRPIGFIRSTYKDKFATPRQAGLVDSAQGQIVLQSWVHPEASLKGLDSFSHIWVIFCFHQNTHKRFLSRVHPPRLGGETMGVFATRSPHRPNSLGLSLLRLKGINGNSVEVEGLDIIDGTPVIDIKPYLPDVEAQSDAKSGWPLQLFQERVSVEFTDKSESDIAALNIPNFRNIVRDTLALDPRPTVYKKKSSDGGFRYSQKFAAHIMNYDVDFVFRDDQHIEVVGVRPYRS